MRKSHISFPHITALDVLAYATMPRIIPRLRELFSGFSFAAQMMALLYAWGGLLPPYHPYLNPERKGTFGVREVIIEAARHLEFKWIHIDRIIMFFVLLAGFALLAIQFFLMLLYLGLGISYAASVDASGAPLLGIFTTANPTNDIAFILLDRVFGIPGLFNSCISLTSVACDSTSSYVKPSEPDIYPEPFHVALQQIFAYYSMGVMLVGGMIVAYFIGVVILESMQTGIPFGKRFASAYAPIRLCLAVLMIVPLPISANGSSYIGYNGAQYLVLYVAKLGSGMGTNTWNVFNNYFIFGGQGISKPVGYGPLNPGAREDTSDSSATGSLVARPIPMYVDPLLQFMFLAHTCRAMADLNPPGIGEIGKTGVDAYIVNGKGKWMKLSSGVSYKQALDFSSKRNIRIRFGLLKKAEENDDKITDEDRTIVPFCGELSLRVGVFGDKGGAAWFLEQQYHLVANMWENMAIRAFGDRMAHIYSPIASPHNTTTLAGCSIPVPNESFWSGDTKEGCDDFPNPIYYTSLRDAYQKIIGVYMEDARKKQIIEASKPIDNRILDRGWAGAGIWYNRLAEMNGALFEAAKSLPSIAQMPTPMEDVALANADTTTEITVENRYTLFMKEGTVRHLKHQTISAALGRVYEEFQKGAYESKGAAAAASSNSIFSLMNSVFGTDILFDMRKNQDVNPMVQLLALGKSIVDAAFYNLLAGGGAEFIGGVMKQLNGKNKIGDAVMKMGNAWFTIVSLSLGIGIVLFYVMPFLPFLYFFFSVIKWLQSIFEAIVGIPMWALAHIRIDGDGIPGPAGTDGYFLLFEIFLRPVVTILGLVASLMLFTGIVYTLNDVFDLLTVNLAGYTPASTGSMLQDLTVKRGTVDQFFYTVVYAVLVYMIGMSCFKLIDQIPAEIMKWAGKSDAKNVVDEHGDPIQGMVRSVFIGNFGMPLVEGTGVLSSALKGFREGTQGVGGLIGQGINSQQNTGKGKDEGS